MKSSNYWITSAFFLFTFFSAGGATVESLVNYPTWLLIGENEFKAYHQALGPRIMFTMVIPLLLSTLCNALLLWLRLPDIPRWSIWATLLLAIFIWVATATVQIPIQVQLSETGFSRAAIENLINSDLWLRNIPGYTRLGIACWMLHYCLQNRKKVAA